MASIDTRSVLEYVPYFRGKLFVIHLDQALLRSRILVDIMLDIKVLDDIGVRLIVLVAGNDINPIVTQAMHCEAHVETLEGTLIQGNISHSQVNQITCRRQIALLASGSPHRFDDSIVELAIKLGASKYICLQEDEIPTQNGKPLYSILESEVAEAIDCSDKNKLMQAAEISRKGIPRVHLLRGHDRGALLNELFSEEGVGTMVHTDSYRDIRPLCIDDIPELLSMIAGSVMDAKLYRRSYEDILEQISCYYVYTLDESIVGCIALYPYPNENMAELGCLFIKKNYEGHGYGRALCHKVETLAKQQGYQKLFTISQSAVDYFHHRLRYDPMQRDELPAVRLKQLIESGRHSQVFGQTL